MHFACPTAHRTRKLWLECAFFGKAGDATRNKELKIFCGVLKL